MSSRALILERVRRHQPAALPLPELPCFERAAPSMMTFGRALERMGGRVTEPPPEGSLEAFIRARFPEARSVCSATPEVEGTLRLEPDTDPRALAGVDVGVVRAAFGVVETGSVFLSEAELGVNALGFLAQHLVVLLDPRALVADLHQAYRDPRFLTARYAVLMTGPSATADIEGVLVRGAQGVRSLSVVPLAAP